jgi:ABC-type glycerol-3-phosphate transport system substrate-binding protein
MKSVLNTLALCAVVVSLAGLAACSSGGGATEASQATASPSTEAAKPVEVTQTLYQQLGGATGVTQLANQFGANIESNPALNTVIDATVIGEVKTGLANDVMSASGMTPTSPTTIATALAGKNLSAEGLTALSNSLTDAGRSMNLEPATMNSLTGLLKPLSKSLTGM